VILSRRLTAVILCLLISPLPAMCEPQTDGQHAGQINALIPAVRRNTQTAKVNEDLRWNDLLKTEHSGRVRAGLTDGSILSVGSDSELLIVEHDGASQQTSLEMNFGKVRSQVVKITKPGGKFELKTPNAVIGVIGTDVYAAYDSNKTTVICYTGRVSVTPLGNAQATQNSGKANSVSNTVVLEAGQMVEITSEVPPAGFQPRDTPSDLRQASLLATEINETSPPVHHSHIVRNVVIASAVAVGLGLGIYFGVRGGGGKPTTTTTNPTCPVGASVCN
jgi:FecR protein